MIQYTSLKESSIGLLGERKQINIIYLQHTQQTNYVGDFKICFPPGLDPQTPVIQAGTCHGKVSRVGEQSRTW